MSFIEKMKNDKEYRNSIIMYLFFGVVTSAINWGSFYLLRRYAPFIEENIANIISIILAVIVAYITNRAYVFHSKEKNILKEFLVFCSGRAFTMVVEELIFFIFASKLGFNEMIIKIIATIIVVILNFFISKFFVFKKKEEWIKNRGRWLAGIKTNEFLSRGKNAH